MSWLKRSIYISLTLFLHLALLGQEQSLGIYSVKDVPNVQLSDSTRFVSDPADYIPADEEAEVNRAVQVLRQRWRVDFAVVVIPSTGQRDIEGFALELFRHWGLGDKRSNNGLLFVLAVEDRKSRFEVGYGLEGYLTDAKTSQIWRQAMRPEVRNGQYGRALLYGVKAVAEVLENDAYSPGKPAPAHGGIDWSLVGWIYVVASIFIVALSYSNLHTKATKRLANPSVARQVQIQVEADYHRARNLLLLVCFPLAGVLYLLVRSMRKRLADYATLCAACGRNTMQAQAQVKLSPLMQREHALGVASYHGYRCKACGEKECLRQPSRLAGSVYHTCPHCTGQTAVHQYTEHSRIAGGRILCRDSYYCRYCGKEHIRESEEDDGDDDLGLGGIVLGSMLGRGGGYGRGGWGGGGFGGGSWGGGSSGGGGSTGSW